MRFPVVLIAATLALAGCSSSSQIVVGVLTNLAVKGQLDEVSMVVTRNGGVAVLSEDWNISDQEGTSFLLPGSFTVYSPEGGTPVIEIVVTGLVNHAFKVTRTADVELVAQDQLFYRMALVDTCGMNGPGDATCPDGQSCVEGLCRNTTVDNRSLRAFAKERVTNIECDSGPAYIDTGTCSSGSCATITPEARDCPGTEWCGEGTCYDRDPAAARMLEFGASCKASLGDGCAESGNACVAPGAGSAAGLESCRQKCTTDTDCTAELPAAMADDVPPTTALCDATAGVCTFACDVFSTTSSGCAPGSRCDLAFPTTTTVGVDCVDATFTPGEPQNLAAGAACAASRDCASGETCLSSVCRTLCQPGDSTACTGGDLCTPISPPDSSGGPSQIYGTCCPENGC